MTNVKNISRNDCGPSHELLTKLMRQTIRAGTNTPSDEYDSYREYRVANTNMYSRRPSEEEVNVYSANTCGLHYT